MKRKKRQRGVKGGGSIEQLPSGKYRAVVSSMDPLTGKRIKLARTFETMEEAVTFRNEASGRQKRQRAGKKTVGEWLEEWLQLNTGQDRQRLLEVVRAEGQALHQADDRPSAAR